MNIAHLCSVMVTFAMMIDGNATFSRIWLLEELIDKIVFEINILLEIFIGQCQFKSHLYFVVAVVHYLVN